MLENKSVIIGYSGHAYVVAESYQSNGKQLNYYTNLVEATTNPFNLDYLGFELESNFKGWQMGLDFILGIGDNDLRHRVAKLILSKSKIISSVIDINCTLSKSAKIGVGVFASKGVLVNAFSKIGDFVILNTGCIIEHECIICDHVHIAPGAVLAGNVEIGDQTFIGANSVIKQGVKIGKEVVVGAGTVVLNDIPDGKKLVGNPNRYI